MRDRHSFRSKVNGLLNGGTLNLTVREEWAQMFLSDLLRENDYGDFDVTDQDRRLAKRAVQLADMLAEELCREGEED